MQQKHQSVGPKVPNRPQEGGEQGEEQSRSAAYAQERIDAQLPLRSVQAKQKQCRRRKQAVSAIQHPGGPGQTEAERTKQIVGHTDGQSQQNGLEEHLQLLVDKVPHISSQQPPQQPSAACGRLLVGERINFPVHL